MSCCGKKREEIRQGHTQRRVAATQPNPAATSPVQTQTAIVFQGTGSYLATGEHSRHVYHFSAEQREQGIDSKDVAGLLRTGLFRARS